MRIDNSKREAVENDGPTLVRSNGIEDRLPPDGVERLIAACARNDGESAHSIAASEPQLVDDLLLEGGTFLTLFAGNANTDGIRELLGLGIDVLSFDVRLSLDAILDESEAVGRFLDAGGALSLGIVPTDLAGEGEPLELARAVEASVAAALPGRPDALRHLLLTPACGLALRTVPDAERILDGVRAARSALLAPR